MYKKFLNHKLKEVFLLKGAKCEDQFPEQNGVYCSIIFVPAYQ